MHLLYHIHSAVCSCNCTCITTGSFTNISLNVVAPYRCQHLMLMKQNRSTNISYLTMRSPKHCPWSSLTLIRALTIILYNFTLLCPLKQARKWKQCQAWNAIRKYESTTECTSAATQCTSAAVGQYLGISHLQLFHYSFHIIYYSSRWP